MKSRNKLLLERHLDVIICIHQISQNWQLHSWKMYTVGTWNNNQVWGLFPENNFVSQCFLSVKELGLLPGTHAICFIFKVNKIIFRGNNIDLCGLKVPYHKKHVFSGLNIYKPVLPEPANSQNEENKWFLHGLLSLPTGKTALLQAVQIQLLSLRNERSHYHRPASSTRW